MHLFLDTSNNLQTTIKLDGQTFVKNYSSPRDQDVFGALVAALDQTHHSIANITSIEVFTGPGSFTGLRVGISIANALSLTLGVPINDQPPGTIITPHYGKPPGITTSLKNQ